MGITRMLVSAKLDESNIMFLHALRKRLANRVSISAIVNELVSCCRVMIETRELEVNLDAEHSQLLLRLCCQPDQRQASFNFSG